MSDSLKDVLLGILDPWQKLRRKRVLFVAKMIEEAKEIEVEKFFGFCGECGFHATQHITAKDF